MNKENDMEMDEGEEGQEEETISIELTRREAITLMHVAWEQEIEMSSEPVTMGMGRVMGSVSRKVSKELYIPGVAEWIEEQEEEHEELIEKMMKGANHSFENQAGGFGGRQGFQ